MLNKLREETRELHEKLEGNNLASRIIDHSISREEYEILLYQNLLAYAKVEDAIREFLPSEDILKSQRLRKDLKELGVEQANASWDIQFDCTNEAEAIGAAYVVEGSAMGGLMIGKEISNCEALKDLPPQHFFSGSKDAAKGWNLFLKRLRNNSFSEDEIFAASEKAKETFRLFEAAFKIEFSKLS